MNVICSNCKEEFDWNSQNIFLIPQGGFWLVGDNITFNCRKCLKETEKGKWKENSEAKKK